MTHRDGFPRLSARSAWRSDAGYRKPCAPSKSYAQPESLGKPPFTAHATCNARKITATALDMWITRCREFSHIPTAQQQQPFPHEIRW